MTARKNVPASQNGAAPMNKSERADLQQLVRQRERVFKSAAKQRSAELTADFEDKLAAQFSFDTEENWAEINQVVDKMEAELNLKIAAYLEERYGTPREFASGRVSYWRDRGENLCAKRRAELRRVAKAKIEAMEQKAIVQIELASVNAQTELARAGLTSDAAMGFIDQLPAVESLMPQLSYEELAAKAGVPLVEQLINPTPRKRLEQLTNSEDDEEDGR